MPYKRAGTKNWGIVVNGIRCTSGTSSYEAAEALEKQRNGIKPEAAASVAPKTNGWPELVVAWKREKEKVKASWADDEQKIEWFDQFFGDVRDIANIKYEIVDDLMQSQRGVSLLEPISENSTANRYVALISSMLNFAAVPGTNKRARLAWIPYAPVLRRYPEPDGRDMWLTVEQWNKLFAELPEHYKGPATLAISTGLRESKIMKLEWSQIDFQKRTLTFKGTANKKGNTIPLNSVAWAVIVAAKARKVQHARRVFYYLPAGAAKRFNKNALPIPQALTRPATAFYKAMKRAGLGDWIKNEETGALEWDGFCWHGFRHTFSTWLRDADAPDWALDALCGWVRKGKDSQPFENRNATRERYAHVMAEKCRMYSERVAEIMNGKRELSALEA